MDVTKYAIFLHVYSAIGLFVGMSLEYRKLIAARRAATDKSAADSKREMVFTMVSMLLVLFSGIYLMITRWGPAAWMTIALISLALLIIVGLSFAKIAKSSIKLQQVQGYEPASNKNDVALNYSIASVKLRIGITSGIITLMTIKPPAISQAVLYEAIFIIISYIWVLQKRF